MKARRRSEMTGGETMARTQTRRWDPAVHLASERDRLEYLEAAFEEGDPGVIAAALGDVARSVGMTRVARRSGLGRESLYKGLSASGNPELGTILRVVAALGLELHVSRPRH
jgi:probable addiction module antidote protein